MSWDALAWAKNTKVGNSSEKLILIALADRHNEETDLAWPSIAWLCEFSDLNRKTVIAALHRLEAKGLIEDSGERVGRTNQIKSYRLHWETVPKAERSLKRNSSTFTPKQSQKRDTEPFPEPISPETIVSVETPPTEIEPIVLKPEHVIEAWNDMASRTGVPKAKLTDNRRKSLRTFLRNNTIDDITEAIASVERSPFLRGENDRNWKADLDFMLQPKSFIRMIEGTYGN